MNKIKLAFSSIFYPVFLGRYFLNALERRDDIELWTVGIFTGTWIPWNSGMHLPEKYVYTPDCPLSQEALNYHVPPDMITNQIPWIPDLWLQVDAGWRPSRRPIGKVVARIQTDPHCLKGQYNSSKYFDFDFCMQSTPYIQPGEIWLPYAYDPKIHYPMELEKETDVCMIGLQYEHRTALVNRLRSKGYTVDYRIGIVYDEYREAYNRSRVAVSWSSLEDTPARCYEAMGMGIPLVANRTPDLMNLFEEGKHFYGFDTLEEAEEKVKYLLENEEEAKRISNEALQAVQEEHTYDERIQFLLETVGLV